MYIFKAYRKGKKAATDEVVAIWFSNIHPHSLAELQPYACHFAGKGAYVKVAVYEWWGKQVASVKCANTCSHGSEALAVVPTKLTPEGEAIVSGLPNSEWVKLSLSAIKLAQEEGRRVRSTPSARWLAQQDDDLSKNAYCDGKLLDLPLCWKASEGVKEISITPFFLEGENRDIEAMEDIP